MSAHEEDIILTVRDRTGSQYSFNERSTGLKYFLSYLVQFLAHEPESERDDLLLMDEPDAFLSSQGQQDLLRIFAEFAEPTFVERPPAQVAYVTHSPFLIDRNHAERVRVLDKGEGEEGTRVVRDVAQNHYEPLRSSFGAFVAETTFIGTANLFLEGPADQVLIAGMSRATRAAAAAESESLDLNSVTLVPAGSASEIPYLVYLARGRGVDRPAAVVLLDSDQAGDDARKKLLKKPIGRGRTIAEEFLMQIGKVHDLDVSGGGPAKELEDLIPVAVAAEAARTYAVDVGTTSSSKAASLTDDMVAKHLSLGVLDAVRAAIKEAYGPESHVEKVGFARHVLATIEDWGQDHEAVATVLSNFKRLFAELNPRLRKARKLLLEERLTARIERVKSNFLTDNPLTATREAGRLLLDDIRGVLDDSNESTDVRAELEKMARNHGLDSDLLQPIDDYDRFVQDLNGLKYAGRLARLAPETGDSDDATDGHEELADTTSTSETPAQDQEPPPAGGEPPNRPGR